MTASKPESVAYLGPPSSYSHQAALECFSGSGYVLEPQCTISDIFEAVQSKACILGVVPFENSTNGSVVFTLDLFCDRSCAFPDTKVCGEAYLNVHHCLVSQCSSISSVCRIYSHPQAFGQCENFLKSQLQNIERIEVSSTSRAAQISAGDCEAAAIASKVAADVHGLNRLADNIEDTPDNTTRFFIISASVRGKPSNGEGGSDKTLLSFTIDHASPGALCDGLLVFKKFGLNLTSISSRPSRLLPWNYIFFVEFMGHCEEENVKNALAELDKLCLSTRVLGSYQDKQRKHIGV